MPEDVKVAAAAEPGKSNKLLIVIIIVLAIIVVAGAVYILAGSSSDRPVSEYAPVQKTNVKTGVRSETPADVNAAGPQILAFDPFIVNLTNTATTRLLKVTINMEVDPPLVPEVMRKNAQMRDAIIILLSSKSYKDVGTVTGKYQLRDEILARVNIILKSGKVGAVYFTEFVIQ
ncbi:MAG: flagellar basal body-associated FliL family protein [Thermodesulfobacteriota bacterium]